MSLATPTAAVAMSTPVAAAKDPHIRYADPAYWEERYKKTPGDFEWFYGYTALRILLRSTLSRKKLCLHFGCGNSNLQEGMAKDKYTVVNIDISKTVIEQMREKHKALTTLSYVVSDVTHMPEFCDYYFGSVLDKGTLDALLCAKESHKVVDAMFSEVSRVLQPGGTFLLISLGEPQQRLQYMTKEKYNWSIQVYLLPRVPPDQRVQVEGRDTPSNDTYKPVEPIGPLNVSPDGTAEGLPQPWDPSQYFYGYACKKHGLVLPTSKDEKVQLPESWRAAVKSVVAKLQEEMGLPHDLLTRGRRRRVMLVPRHMSGNRMMEENEAMYQYHQAYTRQREQRRQEQQQEQGGETAVAAAAAAGRQQQQQQDGAAGERQQQPAEAAVTAAAAGSFSPAAGPLVEHHAPVHDVPAAAGSLMAGDLTSAAFPRCSSGSRGDSSICVLADDAASTSGSTPGVRCCQAADNAAADAPAMSAAASAVMVGGSAFPLEPGNALEPATPVPEVGLHHPNGPGPHQQSLSGLLGELALEPAGPTAPPAACAPAVDPPSHRSSIEDTMCATESTDEEPGFQPRNRPYLGALALDQGSTSELTWPCPLRKPSGDGGSPDGRPVQRDAACVGSESRSQPEAGCLGLLCLSPKSRIERGTAEQHHIHSDQRGSTSQFATSLTERLRDCNALTRSAG